MADLLTITMNGRAVQVAAGTTIAAAMLEAGQPCRTSVRENPRTALCGMGICFECRAVVNGVAHCRTCQILCEQGIVVETDR